MLEASRFREVVRKTVTTIAGIWNVKRIRYRRPQIAFQDYVSAVYKYRLSGVGTHVHVCSLCLRIFVGRHSWQIGGSVDVQSVGQSVLHYLSDYVCTCGSKSLR